MTIFCPVWKAPTWPQRPVVGLPPHHPCGVRSGRAKCWHAASRLRQSPGLPPATATCQHFSDFESRLLYFHHKMRPRMGPRFVVEVVGLEPTSKTCRMAALPQAWSALETSRRGTDEPLGTCAPWSRPPSGGVAAAHLVPLSGRPKPPFQRFNEPGTQRSRGLARNLGCPRQREPVRSYRWQFDLGGLMRGPAVQPPPAPGTRITTCRNRSPPCVVPLSLAPSRARIGRILSMGAGWRMHKGRFSAPASAGR